MTALPTLADLGDLRGKKVLVRSDLNVPLDGATITDDGRIRASAPTIADLADQGARVIVCAHLGRPKGKPVEEFSLAPVGAAARRGARPPGRVRHRHGRRERAGRRQGAR